MYAALNDLFQLEGLMMTLEGSKHVAKSIY